MKSTQSFRIEPKLWKEFKVYCVSIERSYSEVLEELINKRLKNEKS